MTLTEAIEIHVSARMVIPDSTSLLVIEKVLSTRSIMTYQEEHRQDCALSVCRSIWEHCICLACLYNHKHVHRFAIERQNEQHILTLTSEQQDALCKSIAVLIQNRIDKYNVMMRSTYKVTYLNDIIKSFINDMTTMWTYMKGNHVANEAHDLNGSYYYDYGFNYFLRFFMIIDKLGVCLKDVITKYHGTYVAMSSSGRVHTGYLTRAVNGKLYLDEVHTTNLLTVEELQVMQLIE